MKPTLSIDLNDGRKSDIYIRPGLLTDAGVFEALDFGSRVAIVSNETVANLYSKTVIKNLPVEHELLLIGDGEEYKSFESYEQVINSLITKGFNRDATILALGGGVIGDLVGFVAATYQRGVNLIQIPTTLLAQVDAAVGGKTAINHPSGKNLVGAFYQPHSVLIDTTTLNSLPDRIFVEGLAEVIKYGVIYDHTFFEWLEDNVDEVTRREPQAIAHIVQRSCEIKAAVVAEDERESGLRAVLNYGHTFGHALETESGYGELLHGEAVAIGMVMAAELATKIGLCESAIANRITTLIEAYGLPIKSKKMDETALIANMSMDKKVVSGKIRFILPKDIGQVLVTSAVDQADLRESLSRSMT